MKCIQCLTDSGLKDRIANQGRCKYCNHPFAFEPTTMDVPIRFTDGFFAKALADVSAKNTLYFTRRELLYLLEMRLARKARVDPFGCVFFCFSCLFILFRASLAIYGLSSFISFWVLLVGDMLTSGWIGAPCRSRKQQRDYS